MSAHRLSPVAFNFANDGKLRAQLTASRDDIELRITARVTLSGVIHDLQTIAPGGNFYAGTTGNAELDADVGAAIELAFVTARNVAVLTEARRRERWAGPQHRSGR